MRVVVVAVVVVVISFSKPTAVRSSRSLSTA